MAGFEYDEFGQRWYVDDEGNEQIAPELDGPLEAFAVQAGKQVHDIGRGVRSLFGEDVQAEAIEAENLSAPIEAEYPVASFLGTATPSMVTLPIGLGGAGLAARGANLLLQGGVGAAEGALDYDPNTSAAERALYGGAFSAGGEVVGSMVGRMMQVFRGAIRDLPSRPRMAPENPRAQRYEDLGGELMAWQRLDPDTEAAQTAEMFARGARTGGRNFGDSARVISNNDALHRNAFARAVGMPEDQYGYIGQDFREAAEARFSQAYQDVEWAALQANGGQAIDLDADVVKLLRNNPEIMAWGDQFGRFQELENGQLLPGDYTTAREAIADFVSSLWDNAPKRAREWGKVLERFDDAVAANLPDNFKGDFAKLREQYRVYTLAERGRAIGLDGQINVPTMQGVLKSKSTGFGRSMTSKQAVTNPETRYFLDLMDAASDPKFQALSSSGTAENLELSRAAEAAGEIVQGIVTGNPQQAIGPAARFLAPGIGSASNRGSGQMFKEMYTPRIGEGLLGRAGAAGARGGASEQERDAQLWPFVGEYDANMQP